MNVAHRAYEIGGRACVRVVIHVFASPRNLIHVVTNWLPPKSHTQYAIVFKRRKEVACSSVLDLESGDCSSGVNLDPDRTTC